MSNAAFMAAAPEVAVPLAIGQQLAPHAPTLVMVPFAGLAILLIIIGAIVTAASRVKTTGVLLLVLGFLVGAGSFFVMYRSEKSLARRQS